MKNHTAIFLSHIHFAVSDKTAGAIARRFSNTGKLPGVGMELILGSALGEGSSFVLSRRSFLLSDKPEAKNKRGWTWCLIGRTGGKLVGEVFNFTV